MSGNVVRIDRVSKDGKVFVPFPGHMFYGDPPDSDNKKGESTYEGGEDVCYSSTNRRYGGLPMSTREVKMMTETDIQG